MYEHSYHIDYGAKAAAYVDAFMENINWENASALYSQNAHSEGPCASLSRSFRLISTGSVKEQRTRQRRRQEIDFTERETLWRTMPADA